MKSSSNLLWNPFTRIAGLKAFGIGLVFVAATVVLGYLSQTVFIGNFQMKLVSGVSLAKASAIQGITLSVIVTVMYISASIFSRKLRFVDFLGTITLARYPYILAAIPGGFVPRYDPEFVKEGIYMGTFSIGDMSATLIAAIIMMIFAVFATILLYRAYAVSSGLKGSKLYGSFLVAVIVSEVICGFAGHALT